MRLLTPTLLAGASLLAGCATSGSAPTTAPIVAPTPAPSAVATSRPVEPVEPSLAAAQAETRGPQPEDWEITLGGSGANNNDFDVGGFFVAGSLGYFLDERQEVGVRQSASYADFGSSVWNGSTRFFYDYHFLDGNVRPLVGANLGYVYGDTVDETFAAAPEVGVKWYVTESAFVSALAEYQFFFESADDADDTFDDGSFVYTLGIGMHW